MFAKQPGLEDELVEKLQRTVHFTALIYAPARLYANPAAGAPVNDRLLERLLKYRTMDCQTVEAALTVVRRHLRYLRPQTVVFALFSDKVGTLKREMAERLE